MRFVMKIVLFVAWGAAPWAGIGAPAWAAAANREAELLVVLASATPEADKALACKGLAEHGSAAAVPELAKLLAHERLASWARIALEAIPDPACDRALREAAGSLSGRLLVGVINSLGVRRDAGAVGLLAAKLADGDPAVVAAAAAALGKIGDGAAAAALEAAFPGRDPGTRAAVAAGLIVCAERLHAAGNTAAAVRLYDLVRGADVAPQRIREATRGAILARGAAGMPLLVEQLRATDLGLFRIGLSTAREVPGNDVDAAVVGELKAAPPERAALLIAVLADRGSPTAIPAIAAAAASGPMEVRKAAVAALGRVGRKEDLPTLLKVAVEPDAGLAAAAVAALGSLQDAGVDAALRDRLAQAVGSDRRVLLDIIAIRRIDAVPQVLAALGDGDPAVRLAAIEALGQTVDLDRLPALVAAAVKPRSADEAAPALKALRAAAVRMPDRDICVEKLLAETAGAPVATRVAILEIVGQTAGSKALVAVAAAAKDTDPQFQDVATRLLGEWPTADAGPVLLDLAKTLPDGKFRTRAFRGYLRVARQLGGRPAEKAALCRQAYEAARGAEDRKFVLEAIASVPAKESVELAVEAGKTPELLDAARAAAQAILAKSGDAIPGGWEMAAPLGVTKPAAK